MSLANDIIKSPHVGIRNLKIHLSRFLKKGTLVVTDRGVPVNIILPYADTIELLDIMDEVTDSETMKTIREGIQVSDVLGKTKKRVS